MSDAKKETYLYELDSGKSYREALGLSEPLELDERKRAIDAIHSGDIKFEDIDYIDGALRDGSITLGELNMTRGKWRKLCKTAGYYSEYLNHDRPRSNWNIDHAINGDPDHFVRYYVKGTRTEKKAGEPIFNVLAYVMNKKGGVEKCMTTHTTVSLREVQEAILAHQGEARSSGDFYYFAYIIAEQALRDHVEGVLEEMAIEKYHAQEVSNTRMQLAAAIVGAMHDVALRMGTQMSVNFAHIAALGIN